MRTEKELSGNKEQQAPKNKLDTFLRNRMFMFLECVKLRDKVLNDEFGEVDHGRGFEFYSNVFNLNYSPISFL